MIVFGASALWSLLELWLGGSAESARQGSTGHSHATSTGHLAHRAKPTEQSATAHLLHDLLHHFKLSREL